MAIHHLIILLTLQAYLILSQSSIPNPFDPSVIAQFPLCAQLCTIESRNLAPCPPFNLTCNCASPSRAAVAACEHITCSAADYAKTQELGSESCAPLYSNGTLNAASVSSAIASATAAAASATSTANPEDYNTYPPCAAVCVPPALESSGCGDYANSKCVCQNPKFNATVSPCQTANCGLADIKILADLVYAKCNAPGIGGIDDAQGQLNQSELGQRPGNASVTTPSVPVFTGRAGKVNEGSVGWVLAVVVGMVGIAVL